MTFGEVLEDFGWDSEEQKEGYGAYVQYLRRMGISPESVDLRVAFLIQKAHDSNEYWQALISTQISSLENQIRLLQEEIASLKLQCNALEIQARTSLVALEVLSKK